MRGALPLACLVILLSISEIVTHSKRTDGTTICVLYSQTLNLKCDVGGIRWQVNLNQQAG